MIDLAIYYTAILAIGSCAGAFLAWCVWQLWKNWGAPLTDALDTNRSTERR